MRASSAKVILFCALALASALGALPGCASRSPTPGSPAYARKGDEIMIAGQLFHTGAPVVLWTDPNGYDAYRVERRFVPFEKASWEETQKEGKGPGSPNRLSLRRQGLSPDEIERVRGGGWDLPTLQRVVDQFVIHYDVCGTSRTCFRVLHDFRGLSVHFMLDIDGTIYQTCDVKEKTWHATKSNDRSVGIEIANIGAYPPDKAETLDKWYSTIIPCETGLNASASQQRRPATSAPTTTITLPPHLGDGGVRGAGPFSPARHDRVRGTIQGQDLVMYDLTPQQYDSLIKLTAALCNALPNLACDYPRDQQGDLITTQLTDEQWKNFRGLLGHFHVQADKIDPGPAFDWDRVVNGARRYVKHRASSIVPEGDEPPRPLVPQANPAGAPPSNSEPTKAGGGA